MRSNSRAWTTIRRMPPHTNPSCNLRARRIRLRFPAPPGETGIRHDHARRTARSGAHDATPTPDETPADSAALTLAASQPSAGRHAANTVNGASAGDAAPSQLFTSPHDDVLAGVSVNPPLPGGRADARRLLGMGADCRFADVGDATGPPPPPMPPAIPPTDADGNADGSG